MKNAVKAWLLNVVDRFCFMRGDDRQQFGVFNLVSLEERVPQDHPLRSIRKAVDKFFITMNQEFDGLYAGTGLKSVAIVAGMRSQGAAQQSPAPP